MTSFCEDGVLTCAGLLGCVAIHVQLMVKKQLCVEFIYLYIYIYTCIYTRWAPTSDKWSDNPYKLPY